LTPNFRKFGHDLFVLGFKRWGRWCAFLGTSQEEGMNQDRGRDGEQQANKRKPKAKANAI
jgi:hypothetical protein